MSRAARWPTLAALAVVAGAAILIGPRPASAQTGPTISLDRSETAPGAPLLVTFEGFDSHFVNFVVCGNLAYRGATDCNITAGVSKETLTGGRPKVVQVIAHPPPVHCPCIVRATASSGDAFAVAPIVIAGHPVGELVGAPDGPLVDVAVEAREANQGFGASLRSALGGRTRYEATVSVTNNTTETLSRLRLNGSVGHWTDDDAAQLELEPPAALEPGQTWTQEAVVEVSAPSVGAYEFEVVASGAGATVTGTDNVSHHPALLYLFAVVLIVDVVVMVGRGIASWARPREDDDDDFGDDQDAEDQVIDLDGDVLDVIDLDREPSQPLPV